MSIDDHPARANWKHNQLAERVAKRAAEKLTGGWVHDAEQSVKDVQAGSDYPTEDFENAEGIASILELKIQEARIEFEQTIKTVKKAQNGLKTRYEKDQNHQLKFAKGISDVTNTINDLYIQIDKIVPIPDYSKMLMREDEQFLAASVLLENISSGVKYDEVTDDFSDFKANLNSLSYEDSAAIVRKQAELKEAIDLKQTIEGWHERHLASQPKELARKEAELRDALFLSGCALQELERKVAMRSAETKQAIALNNPDIKAEPQEKRDANRVAKIAMAKAYEAGANDEEAFDVWEMEFVAELHKDDPDFNNPDFDPSAVFEDLEKKALTAKADKLAKELELLKQDNEVKTQKLKVYGEYAIEKANANPATVVAERKAWVTLLPHKKDGLHFKLAKEFLNRKKPSGLTEMYLHDTQWDGKPSTHVRRALALRGGLLVDGNKLEIFVGDTRGMNKFECVFGCGTKVVLGLQESHETSEKIMIGTALHHDPRWTKKYENDEDLHGVPDGISLKASLEPEELIPYHNTLKANLHRAR